MVNEKTHAEPGNISDRAVEDKKQITTAQPALQTGKKKRGALPKKEKQAEITNTETPYPLGNLPEIVSTPAADVPEIVPEIKPLIIKKNTKKAIEKNIKKAVIKQEVKLAAIKPATKSIKKKVTEAPKAKTKNGLAVTFQLRYATKFGQSISMVGSHELLGINVVENAVQLEYLNDELWQLVLTFPEEKTSGLINYRYLLTNNDGTTIVEWGDDKAIDTSDKKTKDFLLVDSWNYAGYYENAFYTEPFKRVFFKGNNHSSKAIKPATFSHTFRIKAPLLKNNEVVCLCGNVPELGGWHKDNLLLMSPPESNNWWTLNINLTKADFPIAYKYGVYNTHEKKLVELEQGNNRVLTSVAIKNQQTIVSDCFINLPNNTFKGAGVAIPVFSLRSENSLGIGEFSDLKLLVDWAKNTGLKMIQVLPVNDTTANNGAQDSYPYAAISAFALHPVYLHLPSIISKKNKELLTKIGDQQKLLNALPVVDYVEVSKQKTLLLKQIFPEEKVATFKTEAFKNFFENNAHWLVPYGAFSYFRDQFGAADFTQWPEHSSYSESAINAIAKSPAKAHEGISIYFFIQYHLHLQLKEASEYAHANGISLKGDIAIGIYRNSCDAWQQPELYNLDQQAGAPPDDFAVKGQNWGFPTYKWQRMAEDGYSWWKRRFAQLNDYFDAFRVDHILGFFRIWSIPMHSVQGIMGRFAPAIPVTIDEFAINDLWFDYDRYTKPFINDRVLSELFNIRKEFVADTFLKPLEGGQYELLPAFSTQRKVEEYFKTSANNDENEHLKAGLFDLISNVLLFEEEGSSGTKFHFRILMENTFSFRHLDYDTQHKLKNLYVHYFYYRQDTFWRDEAMHKLPELKRSTNMLIFGEDLGMVPASVPGVMKDLGILSLEIQRMPKNPSREFFHPNDAPYLSVVTPSTHDLSTVRGWWEEDRNVTQRFYNREMGQYGKAPLVCEPWISKAVLMQHVYSPAMWSIFQLQDMLGISEKLRTQNPADERINIPSNPKHYWQYRMNLTLEDLNTEEEFNSQLREVIFASGR